ncbi:MAG TPA: hypothetical protein VK489_06620 [Ferruginibacter sp.]|nr:hypothetical protein [Ferruginibacter sp.]
MNHNPIILKLSLLLSALIILSSCAGLLITGFYSAGSPAWQAQAIGQDIIDLFIAVPALLITGIFAYRNKKTAVLIWGGIISFIVYTFLIYCFSVHFNRMFIVYCFVLGLSVYSLGHFVYLCSGMAGPVLINKRCTGTIAIYFIIISISFYCLWLAEIIPAIAQNNVPPGLRETALLTNPVHVIDLSVFLPGILITGILLLKQNRWALLLTPALLSFFILMDITIGGLVLVMKLKGLPSNPVLIAIMGFLAILSLLLLIGYLYKKKNAVV